MLEEKYGGKVWSKFEVEMLGRKIGGKSIGPKLGVNSGVTSQKKIKKTNIFVFVFGPENCIGHTLNLQIIGLQNPTILLQVMAM